MNYFGTNNNGLSPVHRWTFSTTIIWNSIVTNWFQTTLHIINIMVYTVFYIMIQYIIRREAVYKTQGKIYFQNKWYYCSQLFYWAVATKTSELWGDT